MKPTLLLTLLLALSSMAFSQKAFKPKPIDKNTIVKDSAGKVLPYEKWNAALRSGEYSIRSVYTSKDTTFTLLRLSAAQSEALKLRAQAMRSNNVDISGEKTEAAEEPSSDSTRVNSTTTVNRAYTITRLPRQADSFKNGDEFLPFSDKDINGEKIDIKALRGKIVVLNFWFINCPACRVEMPELNEVVAEYANDVNVEFIGVCLDEKYQIKRFLSAVPFNFKHIASAKYYGNKYGINLYPTTVVLDKQGIIRFNSVGADNTGYWIKKTIADINSAN